MNKQLSVNPKLLISDPNNFKTPNADNIHKKQRFSTRILAEIIMLVALAAALSLISHSFFRLPQGGSINLGMVPIFWLAIRRGWRIGIFGGFLFGVVDMAFDPFIVHPLQLLLDYPLPFAALGLAGFLQKYPIAGITAGIIGRFMCHTISGAIYFADYAPEGVPPIIYSLGYNATYLIPSAIVCAILIYTLLKIKVLKIYM